MTFGSFGRLVRNGTAALVFSAAGVGTAAASDQPAVAAPGAAPVAPCPTCAQPAGTCSTCKTCTSGKLGVFHKPCKPYTPTLCPGACFGYFQTQWNRWEDVCPHPYQGIGISDAPKPVTPSTTQPVPNTPATPIPKVGVTDPMPRLPTVDPNKKDGLPQPLPLPEKKKN